MIKQPPRLLAFDSHSPFDYHLELPAYVRVEKGFRDKTNALLIGEKIEEQFYEYYSASYCKI